jgi:multidrug transporter EmrE-like cation transporter
MLKIAFFLGSFWLIQALVTIGFKLSSLHDKQFWLWFCAAHAIGVPSLWFLVRLYKEMSEPVAFGLALGGAFLASQIALFIAFKPATSLVQWIGVVAICGGMLMLAMGSPKPDPLNLQNEPVQAAVHR